MPGIIEFPTLVQQAVEQFGPLFANEPERRHFAEYLTGLLVAEKKNVSGINGESAWQKRPTDTEGLTTACRPTAARERFRVDVKRYVWAAAADAER